MERDKYRIADIAFKQAQLTKNIVIFFIKLYRLFLSPLVPTHCRYHTTCSVYMEESIKKKGLFKGILCGIKRILRCNPFFPGGYDPVK